MIIKSRRLVMTDTSQNRLRKKIAVYAALLVAASWFTGCAQEPETPAPPYEPVLDIHDLMNSVLDPATDVIWAAAGAVITADGEQDLAPVDDAGWQAVFNAAAVVSETGNLLMLPGRAEDSGDWMEYSAALIATGKEAMAAAEAKDAQAVFDIGGKLYLVCVACHQGYSMDEE